MGIDCSWIQLANSVSKELFLASCRNFTPKMHREMARMDLDHYCGKEVVGLGNRIIIPNLSRDGSYGMAMFERAGFRSLIVVPIKTYKVLGILGAAYRERTKFSKDYSQLFTVIANLVGMALNKNTIIEHARPPANSLQSSKKRIIKINKKGTSGKGIAVVDDRTNINYVLNGEDRHEAFEEHVHKMGAFRKSHK